MSPLSPQNKQFITWMLAIPMIAAFIAFVLVPEGPVRNATPPAVHSSRGAPAVTRGPAMPAAQTPSTAPGSQVSPGTSSPAAQSRGRGAQPTAIMQASELFELMDTKPGAIGSITFLNGSDRIAVFKSGDSTKYFVTLPEQGGRAEVLKTAREKNISWKADEDSGASLRNFAFSFGPIILIGLIMLYFFNKNRAAQTGAAGKMANFGKARVTSSDDKTKKMRVVTFDDVAGADEAVKELRRLAKAVKRRWLYNFFGAKLPKGILLVGPPGTGKTLLARALACETDGSFDSCSGSDFVEMFVGVGSSRIRDMFESGREKVRKTGKPHFIFIDEIDAVGGKRGGGFGESSNQEREQTLNAMLVEMDGINDNEGLFLLAATNRVDMLDDALLRPGRFDAHVSVDLPTTEGRSKIFKIHTRGKPLAQDVDLMSLAKRTYGYSGAEIEGACSRAALIAADRHGFDLPEIPMVNGKVDEKAVEAAVAKALDSLKASGAAILNTDFDEGIDFVRYGGANPERQKAMSDEDKNNTTVHEGGHAIATDVMPGADPVVKITIMNRSKALGYVQSMPSEDRYGLSAEQAVARIVTAMAGRAAQMVLLGKMDTGAANDFEQGSRMAHSMVTRWGMSRVGILSVGSGPGTGMRGMGNGPVSHIGNKLQDEIDDEWRRIVNACYDLAMYIIETDRERLEALVAFLREKETMIESDWAEFKKNHPSKVDPKKLVVDLSPAKKEVL
jgi:cell division protease FtsH